MPVTATCSKCQHSITARNEFGGRKVKCPKCKTGVQLPKADGQPTAAATSRPTQKASVGNSGKRFNPLMDLLDEVGVEAVPRGNICPNCQRAMSVGNVLCLECGYHTETGRIMETAILIDEEDVDDDMGRTDAEKRMARAERDIDDQPIGEYGQDFGDGNESFLIAMVSLAALALFIAIGVSIVLGMDIITEYINAQQISVIASICMYLASFIWIASVAMRINPAHGIGCVLSAGLYCIPFGFMQGKALLLPAIMMAMSVVIGLASGYFVLYPTQNDDGSLQGLYYAVNTIIQLRQTA